MGPHSFECGNQKAATPNLPEGIRLQWGRTRSSAEIRQIRLRIIGDAHASMGPHSFECGN